MTKNLIAIALCGLTACTDVTKSKFFAYGEPAAIICYSGGKEIYRGVSTGVLHTENGSDGWLFEDATTHMLVRVSGACVIHQQTGSSMRLQKWMEEQAKKSAD